MKRTRLKVVAGNVLEHFVSRNSDISGYWAMGVLHRFALNHQVYTVDLDLLNRTIEPAHPQLVSCLDHPRLMFERMVINNGLSMAEVTQALINIEFQVAYDPKLHARSFGYGDPFRCQLVIEDDLGRRRTATIGGRSAAHNPKREHRSTRGDGALKLSLNKLVIDEVSGNSDK